MSEATSLADHNPSPNRAHVVATGILLSRIAGFVRDRAVAHFLGLGPASDVFRTALRGPNVLQNLLGEGTISAAFIPTYCRFLRDKKPEQAARFAWAMFGFLLLACVGFSVLGMLFAKPIVALLAPGFLADAAKVAAGEMSVDRFKLAAQAVCFVFPMAGVLVLSAWALGILNSHRMFFIPYVAPVFWNAAIIVGLLLVGPGYLLGEPSESHLVLAACVGALVGSVLQFVFQLAWVKKVLPRAQGLFAFRTPGAQHSLRAAGPAIMGRGVYQISAYLDLVLASVLAPGAVAALGWSQTLYLLPVSLFGLSFAAAELPELSMQHKQRDSSVFAGRLTKALEQMAFLIVPTMVGYLCFGFLIVGAIYRTGKFTLLDNWLVYFALAAYSIGLVATTWSRLLQNAFFALGDTKTPAKVAVVRVVVSASVAIPVMLWLDQISVTTVLATHVQSTPLFLGAVGLSFGASVGAYLEFIYLCSCLKKRIGHSFIPYKQTAAFVALSMNVSIPGFLVWRLAEHIHVIIQTAVVVGLFAGFYLAGAHLFRMQAWRALVLRFVAKKR